MSKLTIAAICFTGLAFSALGFAFAAHSYNYVLMAVNAFAGACNLYIMIVNLRRHFSKE